LQQSAALAVVIEQERAGDFVWSGVSGEWLCVSPNRSDWPDLGWPAFCYGKEHLEQESWGDLFRKELFSRWISLNGGAIQRLFAWQGLEAFVYFTVIFPIQVLRHGSSQ